MWVCGRRGKCGCLSKRTRAIKLGVDLGNVVTVVLHQSNACVRVWGGRGEGVCVVWVRGWMPFPSLSV